MSTDLARLKNRKGAPPAADVIEDVIGSDPRAGSSADAGEQRPLQFRVPEKVFVEFSEQAMREFGFTHGAKKQLFLKLWGAYKALNVRS